MLMKNRREFLKASFAGSSALFLAKAAFAAGYPYISGVPSEGSSSGEDPWKQVPKILRRISAPVFANGDFVISTYGAVGDNQTDCTAAFQKAIAACHAAGGGRVIVPSGQYSTGAITLLSNVNLHVAEGATIRFSRDTRKYPLVLTRWEGTELMNYSPFIYAFEQENIAITGSGTLDGNADCDHWWAWKANANCEEKPGSESQDKDRNQLHDLAERGVPVSERVFGEGHYLRPTFIEPYRCKNVLIEEVKLLNSPMWHVHPVLCTNVIVRKLAIKSTGPNTDGCDPECCADVLIEDCSFDTGDDCIAIKSGRNADGRRVNVPSQNIIVRNCHMKNGHGGVSIGSEITGGVHHVFAEDFTLDTQYREAAAIRIKNNAMRGGVIEHIYARNVEVIQAGLAGLSVDFHYEEGENGKFTPIARNIEVRHLKTQKAQYALYLRGFKDAPIENVQVKNCDFEGIAKPDVIENVKDLSLMDVKENGKLMERSA
jgi:polygalacturonase